MLESDTVKTDSGDEVMALSPSVVTGVYPELIKSLATEMNFTFTLAHRKDKVRMIHRVST